MTREEKMQIAIKKGFTYNKVTGDVIGVKGNPIKTKTNNGYYRIMFVYESKPYYIFHHQFAYYFVYGEIKDCIDHINKNKLDNRIANLRPVTKQENSFNTSAKGVYFNKQQKKYASKIMINGKRIHLGYFEKEEDAIIMYLQAKNLYHKINKK